LKNLALVFPLVVIVAAGCGGGGKGPPTGFFGKSMVQVTTDGGRTPEWSPDGTDIVYTSNNDLWIVAPEAGSTPSRLTAMAGSEIQPAWYPDPNTKRIVFLNTTDQNSYGIYTLDVSGGEPREVIRMNRSIQYPSFTSDGQKIAYLVQGKGGGIWLVDASGAGEPTKVTNDDGWEILVMARCSPVEPVIAYVEIRSGDYNIFKIPLTGGKPTKLTGYVNSAGDINQVWFVNWSKDGSKLVYTHGSSSYTTVSAIWIMPSTGGTVEQITEDPPGARSATAESINFFNPSFSPDGGKLAAEHHGQVWVLEL